MVQIENNEIVACLSRTMGLSRLYSLSCCSAVAAATAGAAAPRGTHQASFVLPV